MTHTSVSDAIAKAIDEINRLCAGRGRMTRDGLVGRDWTMCIPHQDDDSDHVFAELVIACKRLQAENRDLLESQLAARRDAERYEAELREIANAQRDWANRALAADDETFRQYAYRLQGIARAALATTPEPR